MKKSLCVYLVALTLGMSASVCAADQQTQAPSSAVKPHKTALKSSSACATPEGKDKHKECAPRTPINRFVRH